MTTLADSGGDASARDELIRRHLPLVVAIARRWQKPGRGLLDLVERGNAALVRAAGTFRPDQRGRFLSHAARCVAEAIRDRRLLPV